MRTFFVERSDEPPVFASADLTSFRSGESDSESRISISCSALSRAALESSEGRLEVRLSLDSRHKSAHGSGADKASHDEKMPHDSTHNVSVGGAEDIIFPTTSAGGSGQDLPAALRASSEVGPAVWSAAATFNRLGTLARNRVHVADAAAPAAGERPKGGSSGANSRTEVALGAASGMIRGAEQDSKLAVAQVPTAGGPGLPRLAAAPLASGAAAAAVSPPSSSKAGEESGRRYADIRYSQFWLPARLRGVYEPLACALVCGFVGWDDTPSYPTEAIVFGSILATTFCFNLLFLIWGLLWPQTRRAAPRGLPWPMVQLLEIAPTLIHATGGLFLLKFWLMRGPRFLYNIELWEGMGG